jgi:hypothetical protein
LLPDPVQRNEFVAGDPMNPAAATQPRLVIGGIDQPVDGLPPGHHCTE